MAKKYVRLEKVQVWSTPTGGIHISSDDPRVTDEAGKRKGLNIHISKKDQPNTHRYLELLLERHLNDE